SGAGGAGGTGTATATATPTAATGVVQVVPVAFAAGPTTTPGSTVTPAEVAKAQQAVLAAQRQVDTSLAAAKQALDDATAACASVTGPGPTSTTAPTTTTPGDPGLTACRDALQAVLDAQQQVRADQATLAAASTTLDDLLARQASQPTRPPTTTPGSATPGGSGRPGGSPSSGGTTAGPGNGAAGGSGGNGSGASGATTATLPSASELVAYQKAVDAAEADLAVAVQGVAQGAIVSPISGAVAAVHLAPGQHVTAASATDAIVIVGPGGFEVTTTVAVTDLASLKVGQAADVVPDGSGAAVAGRVVAIGVTPDTSGTTATYPVTVGITGSSTALRNGATGTVRITTGSTSDALAVPTSAITSANGRKTVQVLAGGKVSSVDVQVGVAGDVWTAVTSGLQAGQEVVLADLSAPLPGSATNGSSTSGSGQNRFGGGGLPGGFQTRPGG
ncbi:MAG: efflux transporter, family, subunit, partial [Acidimicrobiales bacterium]|nr:efflux transporter, family, subunit [Acidimicrobiales bacterium]